jgi:hypothetical protein
MTSIGSCTAALALGLVSATLPAQAALIKFDNLITGQTSYGFDGAARVKVVVASVTQL